MATDVGYIPTRPHVPGGHPTRVESANGGLTPRLVAEAMRETPRLVGAEDREVSYEPTDLDGGCAVRSEGERDLGDHLQVLRGELLPDRHGVLHQLRVVSPRPGAGAYRHDLEF